MNGDLERNFQVARFRRQRTRLTCGVKSVSRNPSTRKVVSARQRPFGFRLDIRYLRILLPIRPRNPHI